MTEFIEINLLVAAIVLADEMDLARASERMNIREPELVEQMAELENRLGLRIFLLDANKVQITESGEVFLSACRAFLSQRQADSNRGCKNHRSDCPPRKD